MGISQFLGSEWLWNQSLLTSSRWFLPCDFDYNLEVTYGVAREMYTEKNAVEIERKGSSHCVLVSVHLSEKNAHLRIYLSVINSQCFPDKRFWVERRRRFKVYWKVSCGSCFHKTQSLALVLKNMPSIIHLSQKGKTMKTMNTSWQACLLSTKHQGLSYPHSFELYIELSELEASWVYKCVSQAIMNIIFPPSSIPKSLI